MKFLVVIDMQKDFIDGALGTPEATAILPAVVQTVHSFEGTVLFTRDTHGPDYLQTQEGRNLPVPHCIRGSEGWQLAPQLQEYAAMPVGFLTSPLSAAVRWRIFCWRSIPQNPSRKSR